LSIFGPDIPPLLPIPQHPSVRRSARIASDAPLPLPKVVAGTPGQGKSGQADLNADPEVLWRLTKGLGHEKNMQGSMLAWTIY
jgi:hypothetical protein